MFRLSISVAIIALCACAAVVGGVPHSPSQYPTLLTSDQEQWLFRATQTDPMKTIYSKDSWPQLNITQLLALEASVVGHTNFTEEWMLPYSQIIEPWFTDKSLTKLQRWDDVGDSACWTGTFLAGMAHAHRNTGDEHYLQLVYNILDVFNMSTLCTGKTGYIPRFVGETDNAMYAGYYSGYGNGNFSCEYPGMEGYTWLGFSSRDMYFGVAFGLINTYVWSIDAVAKERAKEILSRVVDSLHKDHFSAISPKGQITLPDPMHACVWMAMGMKIDPEKYTPLFNESYAKLFDLVNIGELDLGEPWEASYFPNNLLSMGISILTLLETDADRRVKLIGHYDNIAIVFGYRHMCATYSAYYLTSLRPDEIRPEYFAFLRGIIQGTLADFPQTPQVVTTVDQSANPLYFPHHDAEHSEHPMLIHDRPPTTFLWQRAPTQLKGGPSECCLVHQRLDLITPYWMARSVSVF